MGRERKGENIIFAPHFQVISSCTSFKVCSLHSLSSFTDEILRILCTSSLLRGCANLPCIIPILVYMLLKQALYHSIFNLTDLIDSSPILSILLLGQFLRFLLLLLHIKVQNFSGFFISSISLLRHPIFSFVSSIFIIGNVLCFTQQV